MKDKAKDVVKDEVKDALKDAIKEKKEAKKAEKESAQEAKKAEKELAQEAKKEKKSEEAAEKLREQREKNMMNTHDELFKLHLKAKNPETTDAERSKLYNAQTEAAAADLVKGLKSDIKDLDDKINSLKHDQVGNNKELRELLAEKSKKEELLGNAELFLSTIKDYRRTAAQDDSHSRLWTVRGDSKREKAADLKADRDCARNNTATIYSLRKDLSEVTNAKKEVYAKLNALVNKYEWDELRGQKHFEDLKKQYNELSDQEEKYAKQISALDIYNQRLSEIWGKDKKGKDILAVRDDEYDKNKITNEDATAAIERLNALQDTKIGKGDLTGDICRDITDALQHAEREILPALNDQITDLKAQIEAATNYMENNPDDTSMASFKSSLEKECAEKLKLQDTLVQAHTLLKDHLPLENQNHTAKFIINPDGTSQLVQRWSTTKDKESATGKSQSYLSAYDKVSTDRFDEQGNLVSYDFSYRYKLLGYASQRKFGGEKINLQNLFETGIGNLNLKWGYDKEKHGFGLYANGDASVFEIKDTAQLNMFNKQVLKASAEARFMGVSGSAELENGLPKLEISGDDGLAAKGSLSIGKMEILSGEYKGYAHSFSSEFNIPGLLDGNAKENAWSVSGEKVREYSYGFGDKINLFEYKNKNGEVERTFAILDMEKYFKPAEGFNELVSQVGNAADMKVNGILEDVEKDEGAPFLQGKGVGKDAKGEKAADVNENAGVLTLFEQSKWQSLDAQEQKILASAAISQLSEELGIKDAPQLRIIKNEDTALSGGYSASENAIYIKESDLKNGRDTLDTLAHEVRHAWQHERAANPETPQDYLLKENLENYTQPQRNYELYKEQAVEKDAAQYAESVTQRVFGSRETGDTQLPDVDASKIAQSFADLNPQRGAVFEEKNLPDDINAKVMLVDSKRLQDAGARVTDGYSFNQELAKILKEGKYTAEEAVQIAKDLEGYCANTTDLNRIQEPKAILTNWDSAAENGYISVAFHGYHGLDESKPINGFFNADGTHNLPAIMYRQGSEYGNNLTTNMPDGTKPTLNQIAVPYAHNPKAEHTYSINPVGYKRAVDIIRSVDVSNPLDIEEKTKQLKALATDMSVDATAIDEAFLTRANEEYLKFLNDDATKQCEESAWKPDVTYGVCGTVAPMHVNDDKSKEKLYDGGAPQFNTAGPIKIYTALGVIKE